MAQQNYLLVGTYDSPKSEGVYVYNFNSETGTTSPVGHIKTSNPSFITVSPNEKYVFAVEEIAPKSGIGGNVSAFSFNKKSGNLTFINKQLSGGNDPCHVETDNTGKWIFVSNYSSGTVSVLPVQESGAISQATTLQLQGSGPNNARQAGPHAHGAIISHNNKQLFVTDLGADKLLIYDFNAVSGNLTPAAQAFVTAMPGRGPRLFTWHPNHKFGYMIEEMGGEIVAFRQMKNKLKNIQHVSTMAAGDTRFAGSAFIQLSPDGKFLYASNRGDVNNIAIFKVNQKNGKLSLPCFQSSLGKTPRNFSIDPTGNFLLVANQDTDDIVIFKRNVKTGRLTDTGNRIDIGKPVCLKWAAKESN